MEEEGRWVCAGDEEGIGLRTVSVSEVEALIAT